MALLSIAMVTLVLVAVVRLFMRRRSRLQARIDALGPGALVFVRTLDGERLLARVISRGPSHFWIQLWPGDARWWVPSTAVVPAPERSRALAPFKAGPAKAPRSTLARE
jgi:hypothetical protein